MTRYNLQAEQHACINDVIKPELDRIGLVTWAASYMLGLPYAAGVFITDAKKNIADIAGHLGVNPMNAYLFDDKADEYISYMGSTPYAEEHIIKVPVFDFTTMSKTQSDALENHLECHYPLDSFDEMHPDLYMSICGDPSWPSEHWCMTEACEWHIGKEPDATAERWDLRKILS